MERTTEGIDSCLSKHRCNISEFEIDIVYCTTVNLVIRVLFFKRFQFELRKRLIRWDSIDSGAYIIFIYVITRCPRTPRNKGLQVERTSFSVLYFDFHFFYD